MKSITRLSLALMMFGLFSVSYLVTSVSAQQGGYNDPSTGARMNAPQAQGGHQDYNRPGMRNDAPQTTAGKRRYNAGEVPQLPRGAAPDASGSSYNLNQPVNQGGVNGVIQPR